MGVDMSIYSVLNHQAQRNSIKSLDAHTAGRIAGMNNTFSVSRPPDTLNQMSSTFGGSFNGAVYSSRHHNMDSTQRSGERSSERSNNLSFP